MIKLEGSALLSTWPSQSGPKSKLIVHTSQCICHTKTMTAL